MLGNLETPQPTWPYFFLSSSVYYSRWDNSIDVLLRCWPALNYFSKKNLETQTFSQVIKYVPNLKKPLCLHICLYIYNTVYLKDFRAALVRRLTAAITLAFLFVEMLCYVLGRLHSSCVLCTKIGLHRWELINKTVLKNDFSNFWRIFYDLC